MRDLEKTKALRGIAAFSVSIAALTFLFPRLGGSPSRMGPGFLLWGSLPLVTALAVRLVSKDWADGGFRPAFREDAAWYAAILVGVPALMLANLGFGALVSAAAIEEFDLARYLGTLPPAFAAFLAFAAFEELGWRGFLVPKIEALGPGGLGACVFIAAVQTLWHLPYIGEITWTYTGDQSLAVFLPRFFVSMLAYSFLLYETTLSSRSAWPAVLIHGWTNAVQHPMAEYVKIPPGAEYLCSFNGLFSSAAIALVAVALRRRRLARESDRAPA